MSRKNPMRSILPALIAVSLFSVSSWDTEAAMAAQAKKSAAASKKAGKKTSTKGATPSAASKTSRTTGTSLPKPGNFSPIFGIPAAPSARNGLYFVARDPNVVSGMDFSAQAAAARTNELRKLETDFKLQQRGSPQAQQLGDSILRLYEEQATYLENLKGMGLSDPKYPDLDHTIKVTRSALINQADQLISQFPRGTLTPKWKAATLISRLKIGDPSVTKEAQAFVRSNRSGDGVRIVLTAIALGHVQGQTRTPFGGLDEALRMPMDGATKAAFLMFAAEKIDPAKQARKAISLYEEAGKSGSGLRAPDGQPGPFVLRAASRMVQIALAQKPDQVDREMVASLQSLGMLSAAQYYIERIALKVMGTQARQAMAYYADIQALAELPPQVNLSVEHRVLDIALLGRDSPAVESQWQRIERLPNGMSFPGTDARVVSTQSLNWSLVSKTASVENVERYVRLHDKFAATVSSYGQNESWTLKAIEGLFKIQRYSDAATRADALAEKSKSGETRLTALRVSARSREKLLGLGQKPDFDRSKKLGGDSGLATAYLGTLDKLQAITRGGEQEAAVYQSAYVTHISGNATEGRTKFEAALTKFPNSEFAGKTVSFLLDLSIANRDHVYTERIARLAESKRVTPSKSAYKDLRGVIERAVFDQANVLASQQQFEPAAQKYIAFQKEFPRSKNAPIALDAASKNYIQAKKFDLAVGQMEALLSQYPSHPLAQETRWQAAETSKSIGQFLKAANHYEAFARTYNKEGQSRKAWVKAAEMHKGLGRFANAVSDYEQYFNQTGSKSEKLKMAREVADLHVKYGKSSDAVGALDRVISLSGNVDDEIWARSQMIEIYLRQSQEAQARRMINKILDVKPSSQDGFKTIAKAKFYLGRLDGKDVREENPMREKHLQQAVRNLMSRYDRVKGLLLAPCEVPGLEWCSVGYYEASRLAEDVAKVVLEVETPPTLDPREAESVRSMVSSGSERLTNESRSYAAQAEQALGSGAPDAEWAERVRAWAQAHRGEAETPALKNP